MYCLIQGDNRDVLRTFAENSMDAVVCDPPYGLRFMGKDWDHGVPGEHYWREILRVAKPGAHLLAFGGPKTFHRLGVAIEDAGWEMRDAIMWTYGEGFPKSLDVGKAIDAAAGAEREVVGKATGRAGAPRRDFRGRRLHSGANLVNADFSAITAPATEDAEQWDGWGTGIKPAWEPIFVARKPMIGTVAENVLKYGTGALNIDGCRVEYSGDDDERECKTKNQHGDFGSGPMKNKVFGEYSRDRDNYNPPGRWPANLIHDGSQEVMALFPETRPSRQGNPRGSAAPVNGWGMTQTGAEYNDCGSAGRFFYCAKATSADRHEGLRDAPGTRFKQGDLLRQFEDALPQGNCHPTVKPVALMRYLCRLVTPPGGTVLDPFCGSGSTGKAAVIEGFNFIGVDIQPVDIAGQRVAHAGYQQIESILPRAIKYDFRRTRRDTCTADMF